MTKRSTSRKYARRWTPEEARAALAELSASGLSVAEFARGAGLDPQRLRAWQRRLSASSTAISPVFIEVARRPVEPIEVVLTSGVVLRVSEAVDAGALRRIADALLGEPRC